MELLHVHVHVLYDWDIIGDILIVLSIEVSLLQRF